MIVRISMTIEHSYYLGSAENKLNSKGQVAIPARIRSVLPEEEQSKHYVIVRGNGNCLYMYTHRQFATVKDNARRIAETADNGAFYRNFMAEAFSVEIDTQGRFVLPVPLMKAVGIRGPSILFIGVDDRIEIWEPGVFHQNAGSDDSFETLRRGAAKDIFGI